MWDDEIISEIRREREKHAERFNYDIEAIVRSLREEEMKSLRNVVSFECDTNENVLAVV